MTKTNISRMIIIIAVSLVVATVLFLWLRQRNQVSLPPEVSPLPVRLALPVQAELSRDLVVGGFLESENMITIVPRVSGLVLEMLVEEGDKVSKGQLIARIDPVPYDLELASAKSAYLLAESSKMRVERLYSSFGTSEQQLEEARTQRDAAYAGFELAKLRRAYADIRSPIDGEILSRLSDPGSMVSPEVPLAVVGGGSRLIVNARVPEKYYSDFVNLSSKTIEIFRPDDKERILKSASILRISPTISPKAKSFGVTCVMEESSRDWRPGMRVKVVFPLESRKDAWTLPLTALGEAEALWWVDRDKETAHRLLVEEAFFDNENIEVPEEYKDKYFVVDGQRQLNEGRIVNILEET